jgi:hypothetical protein
MPETDPSVAVALRLGSVFNTLRFGVDMRRRGEEMNKRGGGYTTWKLTLNDPGHAKTGGVC